MANTEPIFAMLSDRGRVRRRNEDVCAAAPLHGVFVVCDGMGGAAGGEIASHLAAETFISSLSRDGAHSSQTPPRIRSRIAGAVQAANRAVYQQARKAPHLAGMGTTLVGVVHTPVSEENSTAASRDRNGDSPSIPAFWLVHVGDSRAYLWRQHRLERLTADHSIVEEQVRAGQITEAQALESPMRNLITRAVGTQASVEPEIYAFSAEEQDLFLLASDGLTRDLTDDEIANVLCRMPYRITEGALHSACRELVEAANRKGGNDNITVVLVTLAPHSGQGDVAVSSSD
ncbi:serine/threonine-protein phosphatase [Edaphobacter sp. HDX4]|uniref:PP2C family protein-serine/threonine phosphatase n=1 Tax=Edaphobacter sp. HDX4 TaxID=2794064 RepID=UPI002FE5EB9C